LRRFACWLKNTNKGVLDSLIFKFATPTAAKVNHGRKANGLISFQASSYSSILFVA
jgi:hypothetical protein